MLGADRYIVTKRKPTLGAGSLLLIYDVINQIPVLPLSRA